MNADAQVVTLESMADEIRSALKADPGPEGKKHVASIVSRVLHDREFVMEYLKDRVSGEPPRAVLYEDDELGFCICGHVHDSEAIGAPHDHGPSWAIYGQAEGETEMTDWEIVEQGAGDKPHLVEAVRTYVMKPGDAHVYDIGDVHSPKRVKPVKLLRIEGANMDHVQRSNIAQR